MKNSQPGDGRRCACKAIAESHLQQKTTGADFSRSRKKMKKTHVSEPNDEIAKNGRGSSNKKRKPRNKQKWQPRKVMKERTSSRSNQDYRL